MTNELYTIKNKIPELSYAFTANGIELPVLDITHPGFVSCTDEETLKKLLPYVEKNAEENADKFNKLPAFVKRYFINHSFAVAELLQVERQNLDALYSHSNDNIVIAATLLHDVKTIDAGMLAALKISTKFKPRLLGIEGLKRIIEHKNWKIENITEGNPRYLIFTLKKV